MTEELMRIPSVLRELDIENNQKLMTLFDLDWRLEKIQKIAELERNINNLITMLNAATQHIEDRPDYYVDEILDALACIYLELGKCAKYADALDGLITSVLLRDSQDLVKPDEN